MKKMLPWLVSLLLAITLIVLVGIYSWSTLFGGDSGAKNAQAEAQDSVKNVKAEQISGDEMIKVTSELNDIKTNISDTNYIVIFGFSFQLDSEAAKKEFDKVKDPLVKPIVNRILWDVTPEQLQGGSKGKDTLLATLLNEINPVLTKGKVTKIGITNFLMQQL
ncbi:flagellar basal body-associated FliL family protein [Cohnella sp. REN36]|uniref:flagellar basal body-associated FliL family protein n=1 Tax=Cohnella sp. REN36 TaxID=2887347 RepID=UPI001D155404|nr:flagellar basal body-associated FliL family protein [Cohnella sp. REN36]MCC3376230.1 flagellar basal body-associated FliL family protein [Cohnella sp. REN36]